ncbi:MAG TPA: hypothetical protein VF727_01680 [Allosphingosinicella sp.]|jgi:hypothetical protein
MHTVRAEGTGHRIFEQRCLAEKLSARTWRHAMEAEPAPFTIDSVARTAAWLKEPAREQ